MKQTLLTHLAPIVFAVALNSTFGADAELPAGVKNTQDPGDTPLTPEEARRRMKLPAGFDVSVFASEPDVAQPVAMAFDHRGRLWVAEFDPTTHRTAGGVDSMTCSTTREH